MMIPVFMIGAFTILLRNLPIDFMAEFVTTALDGTIDRLLLFVYESTYGIASIYILLAVSYKYSIAISKKVTMFNLFSSMVALGSYIILVGSKAMMNADGVSVDVIRISHLDISNVFSALFTAVIATRLFFLFTNKIAGRRLSVYSDVDMNSTFFSLKAMIGTFFFFTILSIGIRQLLGFSSFNEMIVAVFTAPFHELGRSLGSGFLALLIQCVFWFFGVHGSNVFESVNLTIFQDVHGEIFTKTFFDVFVLMGGCGTAICILLMIFLFSKSKNNRKLAAKSFLPMVFNINEIMIYGLPIVLNPILLIPFIITPMVTLVTSYIAVVSGLMPVTIQSVEWTTPIFFSGYMATGSITGSILQLFNVVIGILIYFPFIRLNDKIEKRRFQRYADEIADIVKECENENLQCEFSVLPSKLMRTAAEINDFLLHDIKKNKVEVFYQPQINNYGKVVSAEALLRWKSETDNYMYPPLILSVAKEFDSYYQLTRYIIERVISDLEILCKKYGSTISISANIEVTELTDLDFIHWLIECLKKHEIPDNAFGLELTEESKLHEVESLQEVFQLLRENGIAIAIDDFGMGHTSLAYLQNNLFDCVKLDGSIIKNLLLNKRSQEIIESIIALGKTLGFSVIAEFVETEDQKDTLKKMGCDIYQGYLYSPALPFEECMSYIELINENPR